MQIPKVYTHYAAVALFFFFGLKSLYDGLFKMATVSRVASLLWISFLSSYLACTTLSI